MLELAGTKNSPPPLAPFPLSPHGTCFNSAQEFPPFFPLASFCVQVCVKESQIQHERTCKLHTFHTFFLQSPLVIRFMKLCLHHLHIIAWNHRYMLQCPRDMSGTRSPMTARTADLTVRLFYDFLNVFMCHTSMQRDELTHTVNFAINHPV